MLEDENLHNITCNTSTLGFNRFEYHVKTYTENSKRVIHAAC